LPTHLGIGEGEAALVDDGRDPSQHLLDAGGNEAGIRDEQGALVRILEQGFHAAGHHVARCVAPRGDK
jgi:hypothetical protein